MLPIIPLHVAEHSPSEIFLGQQVRVRLNDHNRTLHEGVIRDIIWHYKLQRHHYFLEENGKKISKRYGEHDLDPMDAT